MNIFDAVILKRLAKEIITRSMLSNYTSHKKSDRDKTMVRLESNGLIIKRSFCTESSNKPVTEYEITPKGLKWVRNNIRRQ